MAKVRAEYKVYDASGVFQAGCKEPEAALCLMGFYGDGSTVRWEHSAIVWTEGKDGRAGDSYDVAVERLLANIRAYKDRSYDKLYGPGAAAKVRAEAALKKAERLREQSAGQAKDGPSCWACDGTGQDRHEDGKLCVRCGGIGNYPLEASNA